MSKIKYTLYAFLVVSTAMASTATASTMTGYITDIIWKDGLVYFKYEGERDSFPACANGAPIYALPFTDGEKTYAYDIGYRLLEKAEEEAKPVVITGKGACNEWSTYESVRQIRLVND